MVEKSCNRCFAMQSEAKDLFVFAFVSLFRYHESVKGNFHSLTTTFGEMFNSLLQSCDTKTSAFRHGENDLLSFKASVRMEKKGTLKMVNMIVGMRSAGRSIS